MDVESIENEAKVTAAKHVANMLQRPDQLEKVEQYKRRESRKKASVEAMLKTAMQTQLDGVKTGLTQMQTAQQEIKEIKQSFKEIEETFKEIPSLVQRLQDVKEESIKHSLYAAAMENMKHIFNVPESVEKTHNWINDGKLLLAHQSLADLENSRDDLLFEMHKLPSQSPTDRNMLKQYFSDVEKLSEELSKQLWLVLRRTLNSVRKEPQVIVTALRIIEREECADAIAISRHQSSGFLPPGRPKNWKNKAFNVLRQAVLERIEGNQFEDRSENKMWLVRHLEVTRQLVIEDLKVVKTACVPCFPRKYNIVDEFVKMYHESLSKHLQDVVAGELEGNEYVTVLNWLNTYESAEMLGHPDLNIDIRRLGPLLENEVVENLVAQYLNNVKVNYQDWMKNSLASDVKDWHSDVEPEKNGDERYQTTLPVIIFHMVDQHLQVAQTVSQTLVARVMDLSIEQLYAFIGQYERAIIEYKGKHFEDRSHVKRFTSYMVATANNCLQFQELAKKLCHQYSRTPKFFPNTKEAFEKLQYLVLEALREELFMDLNPHLNDIFSKRWLMAEIQAVDTVCVTLDDYFGDYRHLWPVNLELLFEQIQIKIAASYLSALLQRKTILKTYEERKSAAEKMCQEGEKLKQFFEQIPVSDAAKVSPFEALPCLAEVIKLKDNSMLSLEVSGVLKRFSDMTVDQLVALILVRGDVGKNDARQLITEIKAKIGSGESSVRSVFSNISVTL